MSEKELSRRHVYEQSHILFSRTLFRAKQRFPTSQMHSHKNTTCEQMPLNHTENILKNRLCKQINRTV